MPEDKGRTLSSWKEIAAYLGRDERTVRRWELERKLPVHRGPAGRGHSVYAYSLELDAWLQGDPAAFAPPDPSALPSAPLDSEAAASAPAALPPRRSRLLRIAAFASLACLALAGLFSYRSFVRAPAPAPKRITLVVLPFVSLTGDSRDDYFSDGLTEELISQLGRLSPAQMGVIARTSAMRYKASDKDIPQIARELNVDYLIEGSVRRSGDHARITAQLIRASDQTHLWAESYDWAPGEVLAMQRDLAQAMVRRIQLQVAPSEKERLSRTHVPPLAAHDAYLKGRYLWNKRNPESLRKSVELFEEAIRLDPQYASAYAGLADSYLVMSGYGLLSPQESYPKSRAAAEKALDLDESLAEAHVALASELGDFQRDWRGAEREFRRALQLNPAYATAHQWFAVDLAAQGRHEEAISEARLALSLDPVSPIINATLGSLLYVAGRYDEAVHQLKNTVELEPTFAYAHSRLGFAYQAQHMLPEALAEFQKALALSNDNPSFLAGLGTTYALLGNRPEAEATVARMERLASERYVSPFAIALVYARLGRTADTFEWLQKAYRDRDDNLIFANVEPTFETLRSDHRFLEILRNLNLTIEGT